MSLTPEYIAQRYEILQDEICAGLEALDGKARFQEDKWERHGGGGGRTRVITQGNLLEKGGVNFSAVHGILAHSMTQHLQLPPNSHFFATGVSIVLHPHSPQMPIMHMNVRHFAIDGETWWFGGGIDLTPHYVRPDDARFFHQTVKNVCDQHQSDYYTRFKKWADDYFYIKHRQETRGIGGIFFDRLQGDKQALLDYTIAIGQNFVPIYAHYAQKYRDMPHTEAEKTWQLIRRGRYVEFNLVYDAGTKFGLETDGRIESILMSLPTQANWFYDFKTQPNSPEAETLSYLRKDIDWLKA
jgi:coproporphyrinogen III oxidase